MARKLSQGAKAGLIFGAAALAAFLIVRKAEGKSLLPGLTKKDKPKVAPLPAPEQVKQTGEPQPPPPTGEITASADAEVIRTCDPLEVPAEGMGCFEIGGGVFALLPSVGYPNIYDPKAQDAIAPNPGNDGIGISKDFSSYRIGQFFIINTLWPYLDELRQEGKLETAQRPESSLTDFIFTEPAEWISEFVGMEYAGYAAMGALYVIATGGAAITAGIQAAGSLTAVEAALIANVPLMAGTKTSATISALAVGAGWAGKLSGAFIAGKLATDALFFPFNSGSPEDQAILMSQYSALMAFMQDYFAKYGNSEEIRLSEIPYADYPAMVDMVEEIRKGIHEFQQRKFTWPDGDPTDP